MLENLTENRRISSPECRVPIKETRIMFKDKHLPKRLTLLAWETLKECKVIEMGRQ
jgi:hypothetical protein